MTDFTFAVFTYNQTGYIVEQLESIRYQIENYGSCISCRLLICDDHSTDNTVSVAKCWIEKYGGLFSDIRVVVPEHNQGVVKNFLSCLDNIETQDFKILAGDDLYASNNVFELYEKSNFVITAPLTFADGHVNPVRIKKCQAFMWLFGAKDLFKKINKELPYATPWLAPAVFFKKELITREVIDTLKQYKWIEDKPLFYCFFKDTNTKPVIVKKPYILYRSGAGVSAKKNKKVNTEYETEEALIFKRYMWKATCLPKVINPFVYYKLLRRLKYTLLSKIKGSEIAMFLNDMEKEKAKAEEYYSLILSRKEAFIKEFK